MYVCVSVGESVCDRHPDLQSLCIFGHFGLLQLAGPQHLSDAMAMTRFDGCVHR